jgi:peptidoglycan glycosyltransferase/penicillin-binding protein 2
MIAAAREKKVQSTVLAVHLDPEQIRRINSAHIAGLIIAPVSNRYQENGFGIHVLGYVNQDGSTGLTGVEKEYNRFLTRGHKYQELASILDGRGQVIPGLGSRLRNPLSDQQGSVVLTIDKRLQEIVEKAMDKGVKKGAVVVLDTRSKEILAMASRPAFNPYKLDDIINYDQDSCLVNRALSAYNPGSLFKIVVASAALQEGLVGMDEQFNCSGRYIFNDQVSIACWQEKGHGKLSFASAFANSCNPTFIQVGLRLGRARLLHYVQKLHLTDTGISGFGSRNGDSYVKINGGDPAMGNACLGQEGVMLTPLQLASLVSTVADGGFWSVPALVRCTLDEKSHRQPISRPKPQRVLDSSVAALVRSLMEKVIVDGTGKSASLQEVQVAGKTATSQTGQITNGEEEILNTWFAGYFPADNPRWTVVVLVEKGKSGAASSAPVFREIAGASCNTTPLQRTNRR